MKRYNGLLREVTGAGWEPITGAHVSPDVIRIERFGHGGNTHWVLHNSTAAAVAAEVRLDATTIGRLQSEYLVRPNGQAVKSKDNMLSVQLEPRETVVLTPSRPQ